MSENYQTQIVPANQPVHVQRKTRKPKRNNSINRVIRNLTVEMLKKKKKKWIKHLVSVPFFILIKTLKYFSVEHRRRFVCSFFFFFAGCITSAAFVAAVACALMEGDCIVIACLSQPEAGLQKLQLPRLKDPLAHLQYSLFIPSSPC